MAKMERHNPEAPVILSAEDLLRRMRAGTKEVYIIRMREQEIPVRVLSIDEIAQIRREAISQAAKLGGDETELNLWKQKLTLKLASAVTADKVPMLSEKLLGLLSLDEVQYLYEEYIRITDAVNPSLELMSPERFKSMVDALKKNHLSSRDCTLLELRVICSAFQELIQRPETHGSQKVN